MPEFVIFSPGELREGAFESPSLRHFNGSPPWSGDRDRRRTRLWVIRIGRWRASGSCSNASDDHRWFLRKSWISLCVPHRWNTRASFSRWNTSLKSSPQRHSINGLIRRSPIPACRWGCPYAVPAACMANTTSWRRVDGTLLRNRGVANNFTERGRRPK